MGEPIAVVAAADYADTVKLLLIAAKERSALSLVPLLAERLMMSIMALDLAGGVTRPLALLPVPSAPTVIAERGLDFTVALARLAAKQLRARGRAVLVSRALRQTRRPADQAGLGMVARRDNLVGAFKVSTHRANGELAEGCLIVVDDIVTTGATLTEAIRSLQAVGLRPLGAATVAATRRRGPGGGSKALPH